MQIPHHPPSTSRLGIMRRNLNLNRHAGRAQLLDTNLGPDGLVVGHPLLEVLAHPGRDLGRDGEMVRVDSEDLIPALSSSGLERRVDVDKGLVDLLLDGLGKVGDAVFGGPTACDERVSTQVR